MIPIDTQAIKNAGYFDTEKVRRFSEAARQKGYSRDEVKAYITQRESHFRWKPQATPPTLGDTAKAFPAALKEAAIGPPIEALDAAITGHKGAAPGFYHRLSNLFGLGETAASKLSDWTGLPEGSSLTRLRGMADRAGAAAAPTAEELARANRSIPHKIYQGIGAAPLTLGQYALGTMATGNPITGMAAVDALEAVDRGPRATLEAGAKGALLGGVLHATAPLAPLARTGTMAGIFGGQAGIEGGGVSDVVANAVVGAGLANIGPRGNLTARGAVKRAFERPVKPEIRVIKGEELLASKDIASTFRQMAEKAKIKKAKEAAGEIGNVFQQIRQKAGKKELADTAEIIRKNVLAQEAEVGRPLWNAVLEEADMGGKIKIARPTKGGAELDAYNALPHPWQAGNDLTAPPIDLVMERVYRANPSMKAKYGEDPVLFVEALKADRPRGMTIKESTRLAEKEIAAFRAQEALRTPEEKAFEEIESFFGEKKLQAPTLATLQDNKGFVRVPGAKGETVKADLREIVQKKDILPTSEYIMSPERLFKSDKVNPKDWEPAERMAAQVIEKSQEHAYASELDKIRFDEIRQPLNKAEQKLMTAHLRKKVAPELVPEKVKSAGAKMRDYFDEIREEVKTYKRAMYERYLSKDENAALKRIIDGKEDVGAVAKDTKTEAAILEEIVTEYKNIDKWGLEDYVTNMERGTYRFVDKDQVTVLVGVTKRDAIRKAEAYLAKNPEVKTLWLDTSFGGGSAQFPTLLSRGNYLRIRNRLGEEFAEDAKTIQKILHERGSVVAVKPTAKWVGPMQKRHAILEGEENLFDVMPAYSYTMRKKMALDPLLADARQELWKLPKNEQSAMMEILENAKGKKTVFDRAADDILERFGFGAKPFAYSRAIGKVGTAATWMKLGYRPVAGAVNLASGQSHNWIPLGTKYLGKAGKFLTSKAGKSYVKGEAPYLGITFAQDSRIAHQASRTPLWHPLGLFQKAEPINRKMSLAANYLYAQEVYGMTAMEARLFARRQMRFQQFTYDIASLPRIMRGPTGRIIFKFKPYLVKEIEFISTLRGPEIPRYIGMQLALGGPRALIYTLKTVPILGALGLLDDVDEWLNEHYPRGSRGIGGAVGVDVTAPVTFQFPQRVEEWLGPVLGDVMKLYKDVYVPLAQGEGHIEGKAREGLLRTTPAFYNWSLVIDSVMDKEGWIRDKTGKKLYKPTDADKVKLMFGARPLELSKQRATRYEILREEKVERNTRSRIVGQIAEHILAGEEIPADLREEGKKYGVTRQAIRGAVKARIMTPRQRLLRGVSRKNRGKVLERVPAETR